MLASIHLQPGISISLAAAAALVIVWYWLKLGRADVPPSRRRIRRASLFLMAVSLPMFVRGLSFLDSKIEPREYAKTWLLAMLMTALVVLLAAIDAANNLRVHRRERREAMEQSRREFAAGTKSPGDAASMMQDRRS